MPTPSYNTFVCYINLINVLTVSLDKIDFLFLFKKKKKYIYIYIRGRPIIGLADYRRRY